MREAELRARLDAHLTRPRSLMFAQTHVIATLGQRTVDEALCAGVPCKDVWRSVWAELELAEFDR